MTKTSKERSSAPSSNKSDNAAASTKTLITSRPKATGSPAPQKALSKQQQLAALVVRKQGATLDQMIAATGWLPHSTRAALTGLKKKGYVINSDKVDRVRTYRAVAPQ